MESEVTTRSSVLKMVAEPSLLLFMETVKMRTKIEKSAKAPAMTSRTMLTTFLMMAFLFFVSSML